MISGVALLLFLQLAAPPPYDQVQAAVQSYQLTANPLSDQVHATDQSNAKVANSPSDQVHAYVPLEFAAMAEPVNGTITVLTNAGLFETDAAGTIIRQIHPSGENRSGQRNMNGFTPDPDGDFAYIVSSNAYSPTHCSPSSREGVTGGDIYRFDGQELTHIMQHLGNAFVINDPSGEFWIIEYFEASGYDGVFRLYRL